MAVNVSTISSICLYCKNSSLNDAEKEFHDIFDEVGVELQLPKLVEKFFHIKVENNKQQQLCDDCVNRLIELYDLEEHTKENDKSSNKTKNSILEKDIEPEENILQIKEEVEDYEENDKINTDENFEEETNVSKGDINGTDHNEEILTKNCSEELQNNENLENNENTYEDHNTNSIVGEDLSLDFVEQKRAVVAEMEITEPRESEYNENEVNDNDNNHSKFIIENLTTANDQEFETINEDQIEEEEIEEKISDVEDPEDDVNDDNIFIAEEIYESLEDSSNIDSQNHNDLDIIVEEIQIEELEDENDGENVNGDDNIFDTNSKNVMETDTVLLSSKETNNTEEEVVGEITEKDQNDIQDDALSIEEEYLIEEITCSQEYDTVDINEYLDKVLTTKFQDLQLDWSVECNLCFEQYQKFQNLLHHNCIKTFEDEQQYYCIFRDCKENIENLNILARHLILRHYDKLESLPIYGKCTDCQKTFSNFLDFNKHSCCRTIKKRTGSRNYCTSCDMDFQSLKRYVFHMQFHLTNHRPKICLLCGDLFNNSNEFFEHTQYKHNPEAATACIKCDRFFKEKEIFESHMELHKDAKYQYACSYCPKMYTNKYGLNQHMDIYHNNKSKAMICDYCEKEFVNNSSYRNHMKSHASDVQVESFICSACGFITNNEDMIKDHTELDKDSPCYASPIEEEILGFGYTCENCSLDFHTIKQLKQHRLSKLHNGELFHCGVCRKAFKNLRQMRNHTINHKDMLKWEEAFPITRYFVCNVGDCQEAYTIWTTLYYHKKRPHKSAEDYEKSKEFKCQFCQINCSSKMSLAIHVARSHNNSNITCTHCKQSYRSQKLLQDHIDKFHVPVKCDICFKNFKHRRNLKSHNQLVHLNVKRYFCSHCQKGYFYKSEKDAHEQKVHPEFSYRCEICNFVTNYPKSLEVHMDKHNNQQKFKCTICTKTFGRKQLLNTHLKRHENKKEFICSSYALEYNCPASFYTLHQLKTHIENKHPNSKYIMDNKRRRDNKKTYNTLSMDEEEDEDNYEIIYTSDNVKQETKRAKISIENNYNESEVENDLSEENEMESEEQKTDNEYETICS
ncbi:uncharacterized protein ACRADG_011326 [Cochliomyia hominivorax]